MYAFKFMLFAGIISVACTETITSIIEYTNEESTYVSHGIKNITTETHLWCDAVCTQDSNCKSTSYHSATKVCQLNDVNNFHFSATKISIGGWTSSGVPDNCVDVDDHCYQIVMQARTWNASEINCQSLGGHLYDIRNIQEENMLLNLDIPSNYYWLGYNKIANENSSVWTSWSDNTYVPVNTSTPYPVSEDCLAIEMGMLKYDTCAHPHRSICKFYNVP